MFYPGNRILSVDMGSHTYKYIEAKMKPDIKILRYGFVEKEQLFQADKPAREWRKLGCRTRDTILSYKHQSMIMREFTLTARDSFQFRNKLQEEIKQYQIDLKDEFDFDCLMQFVDKDTGLYQATIAGISRGVNRDYINKAYCLGLRPKAVDFQVSAGFRLINRALEHSEAGSFPYLMLDLGYESTMVGIADKDNIFALKTVPAGCRLIAESASENEYYYDQLSMLCIEMINFYMTRHHKELMQGIFFGGGSCFPAVSAFLREQIPLYWNDLNNYIAYLPEIPDDMDLNLYANCLGSLYWNDREQEEWGVEL